MNNQKNFVQIGLAENEVARSQWKIINDLKNINKDIVILGSSSRFGDDLWRDGTVTIDWQIIPFKEEFQPLILLIKISFLNALREKNLSLGTLRLDLSCLRTSGFFQLLKNKKILSGVEGDYILGIDNLSGENGQWIDLINMIDCRIASSVNQSYIYRILEILERILNCTSFIYDNAPFFNLGKANHLPWMNDGASRWIPARYNLLGIEKNETQSYKAINSNSVNQILNKCFEIFEYEADIIELSRLLGKVGLLNVKNSEHTKKSAAQIDSFLSSHNQKFKELFGLPDATLRELKSEIHYKYRKTVYTGIIDTFQTACIFIIMFTTGLRNIDIRNLKVDCCIPSGRLDMLYYIDTGLIKTGNKVHLPVPQQTYDAISRLNKLKFEDADDDECDLLILNYNYSISNNRIVSDKYSWSSSRLNHRLRLFAEKYGINFIAESVHGSEASAHSIRATTAGWMAEHSQLSILLVYRLFGHTNQIMPRSYLYHNPFFQSERKRSIIESAKRMATLMVNGAASEKLSGARGDDLERGFQRHKQKFQSLTEGDLRATFMERIKQRILNGEMYAFMTPLAVICTRNPNDSSQTPCAIVTNAKCVKEKGIDRALLNLMQAQPDPINCIGKKCPHAVLGPWSEAIKESFLWFVEYLEKSTGQELSNDAIAEHARTFVELYANDVRKIFDIEFSDD